MSTSAIEKQTPLEKRWPTQNPFHFAVFHQNAYPRGNGKLGPSASLAQRNLGNDVAVKDGFRMYQGLTVPGFPAHPHKGGETVTIVDKGLIDHADSLGSGGRYGNGDAQWMTAGNGVLHSEMFPLLDDVDENPFELFQIWLNLPRASKEVEPHFTMLWREEIPVIEHRSSEGQLSRIRVFAGDVKGTSALRPSPHSWASDPAHEVAIWTIDQAPGAEWTLPAASPGINRSLYFFAGDELLINDESIRQHSALQLHPDRELTLKAGAAGKGNRYLLLQGKPIDEPIADGGLFVMNTDEELQQAQEEYRRTELGPWPWHKPDPTHPAGRGRFALYNDGREEIR